MLYTNLKHIENSDEYAKAIRSHANLVIVCGRMDANSISMYRILEDLSTAYSDIAFFDLEYGNPEWQKEDVLLNCDNGKAVPRIMYYKDGEPELVCDGLQSKNQIEHNLQKIYTQILTHNN